MLGLCSLLLVTLFHYAPVRYAPVHHTQVRYVASTTAPSAFPVIPASSGDPDVEGISFALEVEEDVSRLSDRDQDIIALLRRYVEDGDEAGLIVSMTLQTANAISDVDHRHFWNEVVAQANMSLAFRECRERELVALSYQQSLSHPNALFGVWYGSYDLKNARFFNGAELYLRTRGSNAFLCYNE